MPAVKVSICIPAYRQPECITRALESIRTQTFSDYEIIITDDSPDNSVELAVQKFSFSNKLNYFKNPKPLGPPENWNEAIRKAKGGYIKILHHDDWFALPESLAEYVRMLDEHPESDFAFSATKIVDASTGAIQFNTPTREKLEEIRNEPASLFLGNFIGAPSATIYRSSVKEEYDKNLKYVVDIDFYIRVLNENPIFQYTNDALICNTSGATYQVTNTSMNKNTQLYEYGYLYNKFYESLFKEEKYRSSFLALFKFYDVKSVNEFKEAGTEIPKPILYFKWMLWKKNMKARIATMLKGKQQ